MKTAEYKLAGDIPTALRGTEQEVEKDGKKTTVTVPFTIKTREAETLDEMHTLVEDGKSEHVLKLAQAQFDIIAQRKIREAATSEEVEGILNGKTVEIDGEKMDFSTATQDERIEHALVLLQKVADDYTYGGRALVTGGGQKAAAKLGKAVAEAKSKLSPETLAELAKLGIAL